MLKQLALLVQNKIALAAIGTVLVAGGGTATIAVVHNNVASQHAATGKSTETASPAAGAHAHTVAIEGKLTAYDANANTITVQPNGGSSAQTIDVNSDTKVNGVHASSLSDLTNAVGNNVQVQATKQSDGSLLAWKITVQGTPQGTPGAGSQNAQAVHGTVVSVDATTSSFVLKLDDGTTVTVTVNATTTFDGRAHALTDLTAGMTVAVHGTKQSDGSILADHVSAAGDSGQGHP